MERTYPVEEAGLLVAHPKQLGRGESLESGIAHQPTQARLADTVGYEAALGGGTNVVPQDRGPERCVRIAEDYRTVHLAGQPD